MRLFRFLPTRWWSPAAWKNWFSYARWRMETYGVFYPNNRFNPMAFRSMLNQLPSYQQWLENMDHPQKHPAKTFE